MRDMDKIKIQKSVKKLVILDSNEQIQKQKLDNQYKAFLKMHE